VSQKSYGGKAMSYHDGYVNPRKSGISVVNPLHRIEMKLNRIKKLLKDDKFKDSELKKKIQEVLDE
jgi:hypothetical protein